MKTFLKILLVFLLFNATLTGQSNSTTEEFLKVASTNSVFQDLNPEDANSAFSIYIKHLEKRFNHKHKINGKALTKAYSSIQEIKNGLSNGEINFLNTTTEEFLEIKKFFDIVPCLAAVRFSDLHSKYLLIANDDSELKSLNALKAKTLGFSKIFVDFLGDKWLNLHLAKLNEPTYDKFFNSVKYYNKEMNIVYDVFFKKIDCGVIGKDVFDTMCELNPQLRNKIRIIDSSNNFILSVISYYPKMIENKTIKLLIDDMGKYHTFAEGKNILTLFKISRLDKISEVDLLPTKNFLDEYNKTIANKKINKKR